MRFGNDSHVPVCARHFILALLVFVWLCGMAGGCASRPPVPEAVEAPALAVAPEEPAAEEPPPEGEVAALVDISAVESTAPVEPPEEPEEEHPGPLQVPDNVVRAMQNEALRAQSAAADGRISTSHPAMQKLDAWHEWMYRWLDNAVRRVDTYWLKDNMDYDVELSTFRLSTLMRTGGRGDSKDFDVKVKFKADMALPGLERKFHLIVDNIGRDYLPGSDPMKHEDDTRIGLQAVKEKRHGRFGLGGGVRLRSANVVGYADVDYRWKYPLLQGEIRFEPRGFYYTDDGFGQQVSLSWGRQFDERKSMRLRATEKTTEKTHGVEMEYTAYFAYLHRGQQRGWLAQASVFPYYKDGELYRDNALLNVTWRDALYRRWIYYFITPQVEFAREDDYDPRFSIRFGLDILFGGTIPNLL